MKLLLWKIIALFSVLVSSLGPQVAAGNQAVEMPSDTVVVQAELIPVVTATQATTVVTSTTGSDCVDKTFQWGRFDLLLWQHCDMSLQLGAVSAPEVVVQAQQPEHPQVIVEKQAGKNLTTNLDPWEAPQLISATLTLVVTLPSAQRGSGNFVRQSHLNYITVASSHGTQDNSQDTIVIRC